MKTRTIALVWSLTLAVIFGLAPTITWATTTCADCGREFLDQHGCKCHNSCNSRLTCNLCCDNKWGEVAGGGYDWEARYYKKVAMRACKQGCKTTFVVQE